MIMKTHYFWCLLVISMLFSNSSASTFDDFEKRLNSNHKIQKESSKNAKIKIDERVVAKFDEILEVAKRDKKWKQLSSNLETYLTDIDSLKLEIEKTQYFALDEKKAHLLEIENFKNKARKVKADVDFELSRSLSPTLNSRGGVRDILLLPSGSLSAACNDGTYQVVYKDMRGNEVWYSDGNGFFNQNSFLTAQSACK